MAGDGEKLPATDEDQISSLTVSQRGNKEEDEKQKVRPVVRCLHE